MTSRGLPGKAHLVRRGLSTRRPGLGGMLLVACQGSLAASCYSPAPTRIDHTASSAAMEGPDTKGPARREQREAGPLVKPKPRPTTPPRCGMPREPGMAKDRGRIDFTIDGTSRCAGFWRTSGYALRDDDTVDRHVDLLSWRGSDGRTKRLPEHEDDVLLLEDYPADRPFAVSIAASFRDEAEVIYDVVLDLGGTTRAEWSGGPLTFEVIEGEGTYLRTNDARRRGAFIQVTRRSPDGTTRVFHGQSGRVELSSHELRRQAFTGSIALAFAAVDQPDVMLSMKGRFDIRLLDRP